ncbi:unnamed protein product [Rotaria magnacalcarata]|uniref:Uncharacterized protein n=1 Tax=Rotaria magnacalcarata TaxID=392030 RepID=A0A817AVY9_9BILA|nr:unnamed protein product [Rotaria magnacalcarata]
MMYKTKQKTFFSCYTFAFGAPYILSEKFLCSDNIIIQNVSSQKISAMLAALTPSLVKTMPLEQPSLATSNNNTINSGMANSSANIRSNASSFGWGSRERKMEENWRMQNRNV